MGNAIISHLYSFAERYLYWLNVSKISVIDIVEIAIIAFVVYHVMVWIKDTRAWSLFKGILIILVFLGVAAVLQMNTILWLFNRLINVAMIALVVIFQPELRHALERLGRSNLFLSVFNVGFGRNNETRYSEKTINEIVKACFQMGSVKTGALIVMEKDVLLGEFVNTGIQLDSVVSSQLLINIFEHNTPLHDGAIILREDRIVAATCYLPLTDNMSLSKDLGTRHRAAVGVSEVSDSMTIVVSEETGSVSLAVEGILYRDLDEEMLRNRLERGSRVHGSVEDKKIFRRRLKDGSTDENNQQ